MSGRKVLFFAALIFSLTGVSLEDSGQVGTGTRVGHTNGDPAVGMPNPAAVYCVENGGTLEDRPTAQGADAVCRFEDGSECGQWAYKNGDCDQSQCARWSVESNSCETWLADLRTPGDDASQTGNHGVACASDCPSEGPRCNTPVVSNPTVDCSEECNCALDCACSHCASENDCACAGDCTCGVDAGQTGAVSGNGFGVAQTGADCCDDCGAETGTVCGENCGTAQNGAGCGEGCGPAQTGAGCGDAPTEQTGTVTVVGGDCTI